MQRLENKQNIVNIIIRTNNEMLDCLFQLKKLRRLREIHKEFNNQYDLHIGNNDIKVREDDLKLQVTKLKHIISVRVTYLLSWDRDLVFCEAYQSKNQIQIHKKSLTKTPIKYFSTEDMNKGYVMLTSVKKRDKKLVLSDWVFDILRGELIPLKKYARSTLKEVYDKEVQQNLY